MAVSKVTVHFPCPLERVWHTVTDLTHTAWRSDLARVEVLDGAHFVEHTNSGYATNFTVTACEPPHFWAFTMENGNMSGSWEGIFEAAEGGTRLIHVCPACYRLLCAFKTVFGKDATCEDDIFIQRNGVHLLFRRTIRGCRIRPNTDNPVAQKLISLLKFR